MHPFSIPTLGIFVAGYIFARWDLVTRLYELAIFAADHGVVVSVTMFDLVYFDVAFVLELTHGRLEQPKASLFFPYSSSSSSYLSSV